MIDLEFNRIDEEENDLLQTSVELNKLAANVQNNAGKYTKEVDKNDLLQDKERKNIDLESVYQTALLELREIFPTIPEKLTNKLVTIRYRQEDGRYQNIFLYNDGIVVDKINKKNISINKREKLWKGSAYSIRIVSGNIMEEHEIFDVSEFNQGIENIIKNSNKCEVTIKNLKRGTREII